MPMMLLILIDQGEQASAIAVVEEMRSEGKARRKEKQQ